MIGLVLILKTIFLGIVEGLTEFLPISSTGHLIVCANMIKFDNKIATLFEIVIQLGAILAVVWLYKEKIINLIKTAFKDKKSYDFIINIIIAFIPASAVGFFFHGIIKHYLFNPITVAFALIIGGYIIIYIENKKIKVKTQEAFDITKKSALIVGLAQILSLIPGVSRAGATIMGGVCSGLSRKASAEFSFFLAIPIMFAATFYDLYKNSADLNMESVTIIVIGFISAFISAIVVIKWFIKYISTKDFRIFGWYRILFGAFLLGFYYFIKGM
jgi:undecaprenyl-diphosphatase